MGIMGFRMDIFVICWFVAMGMVNYLDAQTGILGYTVAPKYSIDDMSSWGGFKIGSENETAQEYNSMDNLPDLIIAIPGMLFSMVTFTFKAALFVGSVLWNATFGLHYYLRDNFGIPLMPWGIPIMLFVNLCNFLGLIELWIKVKI